MSTQIPDSLANIEIEHPEIRGLYLGIEVTDLGCPPTRDDPGDAPSWRVVGWSRQVGKDPTRVSSWRARDVRRFDLPSEVEAQLDRIVEARVNDHVY